MVTNREKTPLVFKVVSHPSGVPASAVRTAFLITDKWDDWGKYQTQFFLVVFDARGKRHEPGAVKIAKIPEKPKEYWKTVLSDQFTTLGEEFFSLGQDESYYWELMAMKNGPLRNQILKGLRDLAFNPTLWTKLRNEPIIGESLLRHVKRSTVEKQFRRILSGGERLTPFNVTYIGSRQSPLSLSFDVQPNEEPPTNIHVLIGPNGVGKTFLLQQMTKALLFKSKDRRSARFIIKDLGSTSYKPHVVSVSFSAFDHFVLLQKRKTGGLDDVRYTYIGLRRPSKAARTTGAPKPIGALTKEFVSSLAVCLSEPRLGRWLRAIKGLEADVIFTTANISSLAEYRNNEALLKKHSRKLFRHLSSGHKLVLLTITRLIEMVDEQTLVLFDEPEAHLHPPLLSAFVRVLSELLTNRNGIAIMATHSPVVLQEVPKTCVWVLRRSGNDLKAERPEFETFGENVGTMTREVFGLEVTDSGFYKMLTDAVDTNSSYDAAVWHFRDQLGGEAKAILQGLLITKNRQNNSQ
jgi:ABC-type multidrug transport system ATPase subunit